MTARDEAARLYVAGIGTEWVQTPVMDQIRAAVFAAAEDPAHEQDLRELIDAHIGGGGRDALLAQCLSVIEAARAAAGPEAMDHDYPLAWVFSKSLLPHRGGRCAAGQRLAGAAVFLVLLAAIGLTHGGWRAGLIAAAVVSGPSLIAEATWAGWARNRHHRWRYLSVVTTADIGAAEPGTVIEAGTQYLVEDEEWRRARQWHAKVRVWVGPADSKTRGPLIRARLLRPEFPPAAVVR